MAKKRQRPVLGRPKGRKSADTRARILAAARACFARTGYAATTNKDIADEAGVSSASIYLYFESKTALYMAAVRDAYSQLLPVFRERAARAESLRDGFRTMLAASTPIHEQDPSLSVFLSALPIEMRRHMEIFRAMTAEQNEVVALFDEIIRKGVRSGEITAAQAPSVLAMFIACTIGLSIFAASIDPSALGGVIDTFNQLIDGTLFSSPKKKSKR